MSMWERASTPDDSITLTGLRIFTLYTVSVAASTMAGVGPYDTVELRTLNDSKNCTRMECSHQIMCLFCSL